MSRKRSTDLKLGSHHIRNIIIYEQYMKKQGIATVLDDMSKEHLRSTLMKMRFPKKDEFNKKTEVNKVHDFYDALRKAIPETIPKGTPPTPEPGSAEKKAKGKVIREMKKLGELRYDADPDVRERTGLPFAGVEFEEAKERFEQNTGFQKSMKRRSKSPSSKGGRKTRRGRYSFPNQQS